jgi:hypothetical protein
MFRIRVFTPAVVDQEGWRHAGGEIVIGDARTHFLLDLSHWSISSYQQQWREGISRITRGAQSSALVAAYRGPGEKPHVMWSLWRVNGHVYVQSQVVIPEEADAAFDPSSPYAHVGARIPSSENGLSIPEWRCNVTELLAVDFGIRWPS